MSIDLTKHMGNAMKSAGLPGSSTDVAELTNQLPDWMFSANTQADSQAPAAYGSLKKITPSNTNPGKPANRN